MAKKSFLSVTALQIRALVITFIITISIIGFLFSTIEEPLWRFHHIKGRQSRAVVAVRDRVIPFQQWGTKFYTLPYLKKYYGQVYYTNLSKLETPLDFKASLIDALSKYDQVDVLVLAHNNRYIDVVKTIDKDLTKKIRLVYNAGCSNGIQNKEWLNIGADTYIGHRGDGTGAIFYFFFLRRWTMGENISQTVKTSNRLMDGVIMREKHFSFFFNPVLPFNDRGLDAIQLNNLEEVCYASQATCYGNSDLRIDK